MEIWQVILDTDQVASHKYLLDDFVQILTQEDGEVVACLHCSSIDPSGNYFAATLLTPPNEPPVRLLLCHSFVVGALLLVNHASLVLA